MARKKKEAAAETRVSAQVVAGSAGAVTVGVEDPCWALVGSGEAFSRREWLEMKGCFVRVRPPSFASDASVDAVRRAILAFEPAAVRVMPRTRSAVVVEARRRSARTTIRATVVAMVAEASTRDREALLRVVGKAISEAGL